jgi:hypothetical protein
LLGLNVAILLAGAAVAARPGAAASLVSMLGAIASVLSSLVVRMQHDYYRAARNRLQRVEKDLHVPLAQRLDTTSTLGERRRTLSVNQLVYLFLGSAAAANGVGGVWVLVR